MQTYKYKLNVGTLINLIHKKPKKAATRKRRRQVVRNSQGVAYKRSNDQNGKKKRPLFECQYI